MILLLLVLWRLTRGSILPTIVFLSIFGAASVVNVAGSGVVPWAAALGVGLAVKSLRGVPRPQLNPGTNVSAVRLLILFVCFALWTGFVHPFIFHGIPVVSSHGGAQSLAWGTANLYQIIYLIAMGTLYLMGVFSTRETLQSAIRWYVYGCGLLAVFSFYQLANALYHIPYPSSILYSNHAYVIYPAYQVNGMWRLNSTMTEASSTAFYLAVAIALQGWRALHGVFRWPSFLLLGLLIVALLLTQSSTGYLSLMFIILLAVLLYCCHLVRGGGTSRMILAGLVLIALFGTVVFSATSASIVVGKEISSLILEKKNSSSYADRTASNVAAIESAEQTYFMGTGWGSLRCSGLGYILVGTVGIPGLLLFAVFVVTLFMPLATGRRGPGSSLYEQSLVGTTVALFAASLSGAEPVIPILWVLFAAASVAPQAQPKGYLPRPDPGGYSPISEDPSVSSLSP
jgi:hypothetical protein